MTAKEHWILLFATFLVLFSFAVLFLAGLFGFAEAYFRERSEKHAKKSLLPAKMYQVCRAFTIAFVLGVIGIQVFIIQLAWFPLGKWDIWVTIGITILIGILTKVWAWHSDGEDESEKVICWLISLILVFLALFFLDFIALVTEGPKLQAIFKALE